MEPNKKMSFLLKLAVVSAITAVIVFFLLIALMFGVYYFICCEPVGNRAEAAGGNGIPIESIARNLR